MSHHEFNHLLSSLDALSPEQLATVRRELDSKLASPVVPSHSTRATPAEETAFDRAERVGLIGRRKGMPGAATDLSTYPQHMAGFGDG